MSINNGLLKFLSILIIFFILFNTDLRAQCIREFDFEKKNQIEKIKIVINKNRNWVKNLSKRLVRKGSLVTKKKYQGKIIVDYLSGKTCDHNITLRRHGDYDDHVTLINSVPISSMRVKLNNGNIKNVTRFKLLLPNTRHSYNEIFVSTLLRHLNIISPKTFFVNVEIMGIKKKFLFQESLKKELLESFSKVEGPILESKEDFNNNSFLQLARISNKEWVKNDPTKINTSIKAINDLNILFLKNYPTTINLYGNQLLKFNQSFFNKNEVEAINTFDALIFGLGGMHSLTKLNRRFYYDPIYSEFIPIYYDGMSKILSIIGYDFNKNKFYNKKINNNFTERFKAINELHADYRNDINRGNWERISNPSPTNSSKSGAKNAINLLSKIDKKKLLTELKANNFDEISLEKINLIIAEIRRRLDILSSSIVDNDPLTLNKSVYSTFSSNMEFDNNVKLIFSKPYLKKDNLLYNQRFEEIEICDYNLRDCINKKNLESKEIDSILEQDYLDKSSYHVYVGSNKNGYQDGALKRSKSFFDKYKVIKLDNNSQMIANEFINFEINRDDKVLKIEQINSKGRVIIYKSNIDSWNIEMKNLNNKNVEIDNTNFENLTGCLTIIDSNFKNIEIHTNNLFCEDSVNFIRSSGNIKKIDINSSYSDAIDSDFSKIKFEKIFVNTAQNDCLDLSYGSYVIEEAFLDNCEDKSISIGEKSNVDIGSVKISNSNFGIVSKDESKTFLEQGSFLNTKVCLSVYNKKQEFNGSIIRYKDINCDSKKIFDVQNGSKIIKIN